MVSIALRDQDLEGVSESVQDFFQQVGNENLIDLEAFPDVEFQEELLDVANGDQQIELQILRAKSKGKLQKALSEGPAISSRAEVLPHMLWHNVVGKPIVH